MVESRKVTCKVPEGRTKIVRTEWRAEQRQAKDGKITEWNNERISNGTEMNRKDGKHRVRGKGNRKGRENGT